MVTPTSRHAATHLLVMANRVNVTLLPFWSESAAGLFAHVEARVRAKQIFEELDRFDFAVAALSKEVIQLCLLRWRTRTRMSHK